jgi:hypothetical protein
MAKGATFCEKNRKRALSDKEPIKKLDFRFGVPQHHRNLPVYRKIFAIATAIISHRILLWVLAE